MTGRPRLVIVTGLEPVTVAATARDIRIALGSSVDPAIEAAVIACNRRLLADAGGSWSAPPASLAQLARRGGGVEGRMARELLGPHPVVVADAAGSLVASFWYEVPEVDVSVVLVDGGVTATVSSLYRRLSVPEGYATSLWEFHVATVVRAAEGRAFGVVRHGGPDAESALEELLLSLAGDRSPHLRDETPASGIDVRDADEARTMEEVLSFCVGHRVPFRAPVIAFDAAAIEMAFALQGSAERLALNVDVLERALSDAVVEHRSLCAAEQEVVAELGTLRVQSAEGDALRIELSATCAAQRRELEAERRHCEDLGARVAEIDRLLADRQRLVDRLTAARIRRPLTRTVRKVLSR